MKRWSLALLLMLVALGASAFGSMAVRKTAQASMLVTGTLTVNPDGTLNSYTLDHSDKLPQAAVDVIAKSLPQWKFKLSSPTAQAVTTTMNLRLVAKPEGEQQFRVLVEGASFGQSGTNMATVSYKDRAVPPHYPQAAIQARVTGTVYLVLRIGRDGKVIDAIAEEVDLDQYATEKDMAALRKSLADASLDAVRRWTFNPPTQGATVNDPYWVARLPVNFSLNGNGAPPRPQGYGSWHAYIPGPRQTPPWVSAELASQAPNAMPDGGLLSGNTGLVLTTPLGGS